MRRLRIIVEGEARQGKSTLLGYLEQKLRAGGNEVLVEGDTHEDQVYRKNLPRGKQAEDILTPFQITLVEVRTDSDEEAPNPATVSGWESLEYLVESNEGFRTVKSASPCPVLIPSVGSKLSLKVSGFLGFFAVDHHRFDVDKRTVQVVCTRL